MKQSLSYGRIKLGYEDESPRPSPLVFFTPIRYQGKPRVPKLSDRDFIIVMKMKGDGEVSFRDAYIESVCKDSREAHELGEGRALLRWLRKHRLEISWNDRDFKMHSYFENGPAFDEGDEFSKDHCFSIKPVTVMGRTIKLYIEDEAMLSLLALDYGEEENFLSLVKRYISRRIQWEHWRAPAPTFLDWIKVEGKRPVFSPGQLGLHLPIRQ